MAEEQEVNICVRYGDLHMNLMVPKSTVDKMSEISSQNPEYWKGRDTMELMAEADRQLAEERQK